MKPPFTELKINKASSGFYEGYSLPVVLASTAIMVILVLWALVLPSNASSVLSSVNSALLNGLNGFYIKTVGFFALFLLVIAIIPATGKKKLGTAETLPEFSNFSWFSMMFGAGLGVGLMVFSTAEPLSLWNSNPLILSGEVAANSQEAVISAYRFTFLHYGFHAWGIYVLTGLSIAYYAYTREMPLTIDLL